MGSELMMGIIDDEQGMDAVRLDPTTNILGTISYPHFEIHEGNHYVFRSYAAVAKAATKEILIVTPDSTKYGHMTIGFAFTGGSSAVTLYESVTTSDDGTEKTVRNRNRNSSNTAGIKLYEDPTVNGGAVAGNIIQDGIFGVNDKKSFGGGDRDNEEMILKPDTKYLLRAVEQDVAAMNYNYFFDWYEHTDIR